MEPSLQYDISTYFQQKQTEKLIETLKASPHLIFEVFEVFPEVLLSSDSEKIQNTFKVLEGLIKAFGISFVLQLNTFEIVTLLEGLAQQGWGDQINKLLELCLIEFSFDQERTSIEYLANLWITYNLAASSYPTVKASVTPFITFFCNIQKVLALSQDVSTMSPEDKKKYALIIRDVLKKENFENKAFNSLEQDLAIYYENELIKILSEIQPKSSIKNVSEIENEIKSVIQGSETPGNRDASPAASPLGKNTIPAPQFRKSFILGERLVEDESIRTEYKEYSVPFGEIVEKTLKKTIGAFLNRRGGRIYIGVSDAKVVKGIYLKFKERDMLRLQIQNMLKVFEPKVINLERVSIVEVPVRHPKNQEIIPGCFVLKIIIRQGDPSKLYSVNNLSYESYIRNHGQNTLLTAHEIAEYILKRDKNPEQAVPDEEFDDPQPDEIEDIYEQKEGEGLSTSKILYDHTRRRREEPIPQNNLNNPFIKNKGFEKPLQQQQQLQQDRPRRDVQENRYGQGIQENAQQPERPRPERQEERKEVQQGNGSQRKVYVVFVKGLPPIQQGEFYNLLQKFNFKSLFLHRMFKLKDGSCNGKAFLNFNDLQEAKHLINSWNKKTIQGSLVEAELQRPEKQ